MKTILLIFLLVSIAFSADTIVSFIGADTANAFSAPFSTVTSVSGFTSWKPNGGVNQTLSFWFKTVPTFANTVVNIAASPIFELDLAAPAVTDYIDFSISWTLASTKASFILTGITASNTTAVDTAKVFDINYADFATKLKVWNLITIKLSATGTVTGFVNSTSMGSLTATAFLPGAASNFTQARFFVTALDSQWTTAQADGFRQYASDVSTAAFICTDAAFTAGVKYQAACPTTTTTTTTTTTSGSSILYISFFIMMIIISMLF